MSPPSGYHDDCVMALALAGRASASSPRSADDPDKQLTLLGAGGLLTMLAESGSGTLAGSAHQEAFNQVAKADSVMVSEALRRDFDKPLLSAAFPCWPVEAGFELRLEEVEKFVIALVRYCVSA